MVEEVDPEIDLPIPALIPADYVEDINQRLVFYRRFSSARSQEAGEEIVEELRDRYGTIPPVLENLVEVMNLRLLMKKTGVKRVSTERERVVLVFDLHSPVDPQRLVEVVARGGERMEFTPDQRLKFRPAEKGWGGMLAQTRKILMEII